MNRSFHVFTIVMYYYTGLQLEYYDLGFSIGCCALIGGARVLIVQVFPRETFIVLSYTVSNILRSTKLSRSH
jgi:hypothetical protein